MARSAVQHNSDSPESAIRDVADPLSANYGCPQPPTPRENGLKKPRHLLASPLATGAVETRSVLSTEVERKSED
jgi:hypothetical protein